MSAHVERASLLLYQGRHDLAEREIRCALTDNPNDALARAVLAKCLIQSSQYTEAVEEARLAIGCDPNLSLAYFTLALAYYQKNYFPEAEKAVREAILLDPCDPDNFALLSAILARQEKWTESLEAAEQGLENDAEHAWCANQRSMALVNLGRKSEASEATEEALSRDPEDAFTHATRGWGLLHEKDPKRAQEHFLEALRLNPNLDYARTGMVEAMKARYWLYRQILGYFLWVQRLSPRMRWAFIIGMYVLYQVVRVTAENKPELQPFLYPLMIAYAVFTLTTWTAVPLSNLFLRLNRFGRMALTPVQRRASFWVGVFVLLALVSLGWYLFASEDYSFLGWIFALEFMILLIPIAGTSVCHSGWPRWVMVWYTMVMVGVVFAAAILLVSGYYLQEQDYPTAHECAECAFSLLIGNIWAAFIGSLLANWLNNVRPRR
jgi:tetratricopeptide (TPR) repeat protein